jgi:hypothetical protein
MDPTVSPFVVFIALILLIVLASALLRDREP